MCGWKLAYDIRFFKDIYQAVEAVCNYLSQWEFCWDCVSHFWRYRLDPAAGPFVLLGIVVTFIVVIFVCLRLELEQREKKKPKVSKSAAKSRYRPKHLKKKKRGKHLSGSLLIEPKKISEEELDIGDISERIRKLCHRP